MHSRLKKISDLKIDVKYHEHEKIARQRELEENKTLLIDLRDKVECIESESKFIFNKFKIFSVFVFR